MIKASSPDRKKMVIEGLQLHKEENSGMDKNRGKYNELSFA